MALGITERTLNDHIIEVRDMSGSDQHLNYEFNYYGDNGINVSITLPDSEVVSYTPYMSNQWNLYPETVPEPCDYDKEFIVRKSKGSYVVCHYDPNTEMFLQIPYGDTNYKDESIGTLPNNGYQIAYRSLGDIPEEFVSKLYYR